MQRDAWRTYLEVALGLVDKPRQKAKQVIESLGSQRGVSIDQLKALTEELVETSLANRESVAKLVRGELERALSVVGFGHEGVTELKERVDELERRVSALEAAPSTAGRAQAAKAAGKKAAPKKAAKKAAPAKTAETTAASKVAKKTTAKKASAKKASAKKAAPSMPDSGAP
jgi:polyhydroxyalkanoate synthesis regulator phasin